MCLKIFSFLFLMLLCLQNFSFLLSNENSPSASVLKDDVAQFNNFEIEDTYYINDKKNVQTPLRTENSGSIDVFLLLSIFFGIIGIIVIIILGIYVIFSHIVKDDKNRLYNELAISNINSKNEYDRKMAHSAQMFNYQMQKTKLLEEEKLNYQKYSTSEEDDDNESSYEEEESMVFGSPGLASIQDIIISNPMVENTDVNKLSVPTSVAK